MEHPSTFQSGDYKNLDAKQFAFLSILIISISTLYVITCLILDGYGGGNAWKQGGWLINAENTFIRRGTFGSLILFLSEKTRTNPVNFVIFIQIFLVFILFAITLNILKNLPSSKSSYFLAICPAFFFLFWAAEPQASARKEIFSFISMALLVLPIFYRKEANIFLILSSIFYALGVIGHEANILFLPAIAGGIIFLWGKDLISKNLLIISISISTLTAIYSLFIAFSYTGISDSNIICEPLMERGLKEGICDGSIKWLELDAQHAFSIVEKKIISGKAFGFLLSYFIVTLIVIYTNSRYDKFYFLNAIYISYGLLFSPLYLVAIDWGRFINFHFTAYLFTFFILFGSNTIKQTNEIPKGVIISAIIASLIWSPGYTFGLNEGGVTKEIFNLIFG